MDIIYISDTKKLGSFTTFKKDITFHVIISYNFPKKKKKKDWVYLNDNTTNIIKSTIVK